MLTSQEENQRISAQAVGAYGEKVVEAELLRRGWITSNVNASIKNAVDFDLFALKKDHSIQLRVKTSGPRMEAFQFGFRHPEAVVAGRFSASDFTVLVRMGTIRQDDQFYVIPTGVVRKAIVTWRNAYLVQSKRDGSPRKDTAHWTLHLPELRSGEERPNYGFARKWDTYRESWRLLEG